MFKENSEFIQYLEKKLEVEKLSITSEWQNTEGWSYETFCLGLEYVKDGEKVTQDTVLRREPAGGILEPYDISIEYRTVSSLQDCGVSLPKTFWLEPDTSILERPFYVMEKVEGEVLFIKPLSRIDRFSDEEQRSGLAKDFVDNIIALHNCDWASCGMDFLGTPDIGKGSALAQISHWEEMIQRTKVRHNPLIAFALNWLKSNAPENDRVVVVHGDYRTGNYISQGDRITAVLDWEMAHLGDPHEDLAYIFLPWWCSPPPHNRISHLILKDDFIKHYEAGTGIKVDRQKLAYYGVFMAIKSLGIACTAAHSFATKENTDLRPAILGQEIDIHLAHLANELKVQLEA